MIIEKGKRYTLHEWKDGGIILALHDPPPWGGKLAFFKRHEDGTLELVSCIEEQGVSPVSYSSAQAIELLRRKAPPGAGDLAYAFDMRIIHGSYESAARYALGERGTRDILENSVRVSGEQVGSSSPNPPSPPIPPGLRRAIRRNRGRFTE